MKKFIICTISLLFSVSAFLCLGCSQQKNVDVKADSTNLVPLYQDDTFANFLRALPRKDAKVPVRNFHGNYAGMEDMKYCVVDFPLLSDIEQCADVCMHLRAEFLFQQGEYEKIHFHDVNGKNHPFRGGNSKDDLDAYLKKIYSIANTYSLFQEMATVGEWSKMRPGDLFIYPAHGGGLGHTVIVMDVAKDDKGYMYYQVGQGYTPACDFHIIKNTHEGQATPWFRLDPQADTITIVGYDFTPSQLKRWE